MRQTMTNEAVKPAVGMTANERLNEGSAIGLNEGSAIGSADRGDGQRHQNDEQALSDDRRSPLDALVREGARQMGC